MCKMSESIGKLAEALAKAQAELRPAQMNAVNPFLKSKYADLGAVIEAAKLVLPKNGLAYSQLPVDVGDQVGVTTILMHASGEWLSSTISLKNVEERGKSGAQLMGSNISYLRRYALASLIGIYADEDADGEQVVKPVQQAAKQAPAPVTGAEPTQPAAAALELKSQPAGAAWTKDVAVVKRVTNFAFGANTLSENELHEALGGKLHDFAGSEREAIDAIKAYVARKAGSNAA